MTLAQVDLSSVPSLVVVIIGGSGVLFLLNQALTFWKEHMREKPAPADTYATKAEHSELKHRVEELSEKIETNFRALDHKRSVSIAGLHDDLNATRQTLEARIDAMPQRTIVLLNETKQLHRA